MQMTQVNEHLNRIEQCADDALSAMKGAADAPQELRGTLTEFHRQARDLRDSAKQSIDEQRLISEVDRLEKTGDRAKEACQSAGNVDQKLQSAVMRAHDEVSSLKRQLH